MHTYRSNESKKVKNMNITNNLDSSLISNKSKNSFRDLNDYRNHTPVDRPNQTQESASKVKQMLSNLISADHKSPTSLFGQSLKEKQALDTRSTRGDSTYSRNGSTNKMQLNKTPKNDESYYNKVAPQSTRELNQNNGNLHNLYYMFQNKPSDPSMKQNVLTLSQLAKEQQQQRNSNNTTPQRNGTPINNSQQYINQIQILKQKIDNSLQRKPSPKTEKQTNNQQIIKNSKPVVNNYLQKHEEISSHITKLVLEKEQLWNQILPDLENVNFQSLTKICSQLQQNIKELSEKPNSEYLYDIDINITDTFLLESYTILILTIEYIKSQSQLDQNVRNLVIYVSQSNFYLLQTINAAIVNDQLKQRIEMRQLQQRKTQHKGKQALQKNNFIIRSILELIPEVYSQLGFNQNSLDIYYVQQKKILNQIAKEIPKQEIHSNSSSNKSSKIIDKKKTNLLPQKPSKSYTLVLDLDETLVHYQEFPNGGGQFLVRPHAEDFLEQLSKVYEIVIFTAAQPDYANFIIDIIDKQQVVSARLYREHTFVRDNVYIKDLSILGRNLQKVIIVDNMPENFQLQPENGIYIQSWTGDQKDRALKDLQPLLEQIALKKCKDVREALNQFREQMIEKVQQGIKNPYQNLQLV